MILRIIGFEQLWTTLVFTLWHRQMNMKCRARSHAAGKGDIAAHFYARQRVCW
jgi:hypothetical protein